MTQVAIKKWTNRLILALKAYVVYKFYRVWFPRKVKSVKGATVLVTGAGGGLGACICREFAKRGVAKLVLWDINEETVNKMAQELRQAYPTLKSVSAQKVNLAKRENIYETAKAALQSVGGRVDVLVNNAGIVSGQNFLETSDDKNELTFAVNTMAQMYTAKAFVPAMLQNTGADAAVINIASMASFVGAPQMVDYAASKYASRGFSDALSAEFKQLGLWNKVKVSCICPAHMDTKLFKGFNMTGSITMSPEFVASKVVTAYECEQELVLLPRIQSPAAPIIGFLQMLGFHNLPSPDKKSPLAGFDRRQADEVFDKMGAKPDVA